MGTWEGECGFKGDPPGLGPLAPPTATGEPATDCDGLSFGLAVPAPARMGGGVADMAVPRTQPHRLFTILSRKRKPGIT